MTLSWVGCQQKLGGLIEKLKRTTRSLESDRARVAYWLERAQDEPTKRRLKRELEDIGHRLGKLKRGLLF